MQGMRSAILFYQFCPSVCPSNAGTVSKQMEISSQTFSEKSAQRDANTARALAVVRFGHRRAPARPLHTHRQDRLKYTAPQLASAQCNKMMANACVISAGRQLYTPDGVQLLRPMSDGRQSSVSQKLSDGVRQRRSRRPVCPGRRPSSHGAVNGRRLHEH